MTDPAPRLFCIPASASPMVAVVRRGPAKWWNIGQWNTRTLRFDAGAWFRGTLYPQRCDLSPDGRWFTYLALKPMAQWAGGSTFVAISRFPWLKVLAAWNVGTTYSRGIHFVDHSRGWLLDDPSVGDCRPCQRQTGLHWTAPAQFAVERRRGWTETRDSPPRGASDMWDERRVAIIEKSSVHGHALRVGGLYAAFRGLPELWPPAESTYTLTVRGRSKETLDDVSWADWDERGRLLVATRDGRLQIREVGRSSGLVFEEDLREHAPDPGPAPQWASAW